MVVFMDILQVNAVFLSNVLTIKKKTVWKWK